MLNYRCLLVGWASFFMFFGHRGALAQENPDKKAIEIFANGQEYHSVEDYKLAKIQKVAEELWPSQSSETIRAFINDLMKNSKVDDLMALSEDKLRALLKESYPKYLQQSQATPQETEVQQMQDFLAEYNAKHQDEAPLSLDPKKVKTIIMSNK